MSNQYGKIIKLNSKTLADQSLVFDFKFPDAIQNVVIEGEAGNGLSYPKVFFEAGSTANFKWKMK